MKLHAQNKTVCANITQNSHKPLISQEFELSNTAETRISLHLYQYVDISDDQVESFRKTLSEKELRRCAEMSERLAIRYIIERGATRECLAQALNKLATELEFTRADSGKPYLLIPDSGASELFFNISHSRDFFVCAISSEAEIGVDIETSARSNRFERVANHYFSEEENAFLQKNPDQYESHFTHFWTVKESIGKLLGCGVNKTFLKNSTNIKDEKYTPNASWLGCTVSTQSLRKGNNFLSVAVEGKRIPEIDILDKDWGRL